MLLAHRRRKSARYSTTYSLNIHSWTVKYSCKPYYHVSLLYKYVASTDVGSACGACPHESHIIVEEFEQLTVKMTDLAVEFELLKTEMTDLAGLVVKMAEVVVEMAVCCCAVRRLRLLPNVLPFSMWGCHMETIKALY